MEIDGKTRERFRQFVVSPYFNQHQKTIELLEYILKYIDKKPAKLDRQVVFRHLFPQEVFSEQGLFNIMSSLKKLYHRFLAHEQLNEHPFEEEILLMDAAYNRSQFDLLNNRAKQLNKQFRQYPYADSDFYLTRYRYYETLGYYSYRYKDRSKVGIFQDMVDHLDRYYLLEKLRHSSELTVNILAQNSQFELHFLDQVMDIYRQNEERFTDDPAIQLYYTILMSLREEENEEHYEKLKQLLDGNIEYFNPRDRTALYAAACNYCIRKINPGFSQYQHELFELYKKGLTTGLIMDNGTLSEWNYKNITVLGCLLKEFSWIEYFLEEFKLKLPLHRQKNAYNYNMAHLHYTKQRYSEALDHLLQVEFSDVKYHLNYNSLLLATYYALGDIEALLSLIDTFRIYVIRNKKITTDQKRSYTNFLRFAKKLAILKNQPDGYGKNTRGEKFARLYEKIQQTSNMVNRYWLEKTCKEEAGDAILAV